MRRFASPSLASFTLTAFTLAAQVCKCGSLAMQRLAAIVDNEDALKMGKERLNEEKELKMEKFGVKGWCRSWNGKGVSGYWFGVLGYAEHREKLYLGEGVVKVVDVREGGGVW
ncbi:hypothetical protein LR48_Vigan10g170900 [Vigna angularis]|uniref:Uncharacterized protein n=1 Tax=Phaseolus angularis TaxID=3914 RepID=A0A0L9VLN0_PHAAN|nr:hypothetical protein LR48_Vigan10g170900 [Vigna angularis]